MDVLTDVLGSMRLSGEVFCRTELSSPWGIAVPPVEGAMFHVLDRGNGWLKVDGEDDPIPLAGGDLIVLPRSRPHAIFDAQSSTLIELGELAKMKGDDSYTFSYGGGGTPTTLICGRFNLQGGGEHALFPLLPPLLHIKGEQGRAVEWL